MKINPMIRALGVATLGISSAEPKTNVLRSVNRATLPTQTNAQTDTMLRHLSLANTSSPALQTGTYVETDRTGNRFSNRGVNLVDNVFMGFSKVHTDGNVDLPADFQTKKAAAAPDARQSVSLGGATYTSDFRTCLASETSLDQLIANTITLAQTQNVAIDFDFEFPNSASEATAYARLIQEVTTALDAPVFVALPYMSQMHWMMNSPEIKSVLENPLVHTEVFGYDMTRVAAPNGEWAAYDKGSCVRDDLNDPAQVQWIPTSADTWMPTRLSIESYLNLLTDTFGLPEDTMSRAHVGLPGYTALQREDWSHISGVGAPDRNCLVHEVTVSKNGVSYTDYAMTASDIADTTSLFRNGSMGHHVGGVFIYEAGHLVGPEFIRGMVTAAGDSFSDDTQWAAPVVTAATTELCASSRYDCVASRVSYGDENNAALKAEVLESGSGVNFSQDDIAWYTREYANAAAPSGETTGFKTVELQAISRYGEHVASITIDDNDMQRSSLDTVKVLFQNTVPGGSINEVHDTDDTTAESTGAKGNSLILALTLGVGIPSLLVCLRVLSCYTQSSEHTQVHTDESAAPKGTTTGDIELGINTGDVAVTVIPTEDTATL
jgi:hypothetical protein